MAVSRYIELIIENAESIVRNLKIEREESIKPLNIEDIAWHLTSDNVQVNPFTLYKYLVKRVTKKNVYRKPYLGIVGDSINFLKSLSMISKTVSIPTLILGVYREDAIAGLFKLVDYGIISFKNIHEVDMGLEVKELSLFDIRFSYFIQGNTIIFISDYLTSVSILLYLIRPIMNLLYKIPFLLYPVKEIRYESRKNILYLDQRSKPVKTYEALRYVGLMIGANKAVVEDLYAAPSS